jgi:hypothetical protein
MQKLKQHCAASHIGLLQALKESELDLMALPFPNRSNKTAGLKKSIFYFGAIS